MDWLISELWSQSALQMLLLVLALGALLLAAIGRRDGWESRKWLSTFGLLAPIAALVLTMFDLAISYQRMLVIEGFVASVLPPVPFDMRTSVLSQQVSPARELIGVLVGLIMPIATWVWGRVHWPERAQRGLRWLALVAACIVTLAGLGVWYWSRGYIYPGLPNLACRPHGWAQADISFIELEQVRNMVIHAGMLLGALAICYGLIQAFRGRSMNWRGWAALLAFVGVAGLAKVWTSDERRDTQEYFPWQSPGHNGWNHLQVHVDDPFAGPVLEHCTYDWTGMRELQLSVSDAAHALEYQQTWGERIDDHCTASNAIGPIIAEPDLPIARVRPPLESARAHGFTRFGVASLRPISTTRATTGEFFRLQTCLVEFVVADEGIPLEHFTTWGDLAAVADAAEGTLVVALP